MREHSILYDRDEHGEYLHSSPRCSAPASSSRSRNGWASTPGSATRTVPRYGWRPPGTRPAHHAAGHAAARGPSPGLLAGPPDRPEPVATRAGGRRRRRRVPVRRPAPDPGDPARTALSAGHRPGPDAHDQGAPRGHRHRGPGHRAGSDPPEADVRDFERFLAAGAELGARHVITQLPDPDRARKTDRFAQLCELARPLGLTIDLEFPSWTETPDLREAIRVMRAANQPNAGILVDLLHFARSGSSVADLRQPAEWFHFVHVCDAPPGVPTNEELIYTARFERLFPGEGGIDPRHPPRCRRACRTRWRSPARRSSPRSARRNTPASPSPPPAATSTGSPRWSRRLRSCTDGSAVPSRTR